MATPPLVLEIGQKLWQYYPILTTIVLVKRKEGRHYVIVKQRDSDVKTVEFTPNR